MEQRKGEPMSEERGLIRGLEGVVAAETQLCDLDGRNGRLAYRGYDIDELARLASFEEVSYLLWHGDLPKAAQLDSLTVALSAAREIPKELVQAFRLMPKDTDPMRVLQASVAMLGMFDDDTTDFTVELVDLEVTAAGAIRGGRVRIEGGEIPDVSEIEEIYDGSNLVTVVLTTNSGTGTETFLFNLSTRQFIF